MYYIWTFQFKLSKQIKWSRNCKGMKCYETKWAKLKISNINFSINKETNAWIFKPFGVRLLLPQLHLIFLFRKNSCGKLDQSMHFVSVSHVEGIKSMVNPFRGLWEQAPASHRHVWKEEIESFHFHLRTNHHSMLSTIHITVVCSHHNLTIFDVKLLFDPGLIEEIIVEEA